MHASEILHDGFGETSGTYVTEADHSGVWMFDRLVDKRMGGGAEAVILELDIPEAVVLPYESIANLPYRQFLIPAAILNLYGPASIHEE